MVQCCSEQMYFLLLGHLKTRMVKHSVSTEVWWALSAVPRVLLENILL